MQHVVRPSPLVIFSRTSRRSLAESRTLSKVTKRRKVPDAALRDSCYKIFGYPTIQIPRSALVATPKPRKHEMSSAFSSVGLKVFAVLGSAFLLAACSSNNDDDSPGTGQAEQPPPPPPTAGTLIENPPPRTRLVLDQPTCSTSVEPEFHGLRASWISSSIRSAASTFIRFDYNTRGSGCSNPRPPRAR